MKKNSQSPELHSKKTSVKTPAKVSGKAAARARKQKRRRHVVRVFSVTLGICAATGSVILLLMFITMQKGFSLSDIAFKVTEKENTTTLNWETIDETDEKVSVQGEMENKTETIYMENYADTLQKSDLVKNEKGRILAKKIPMNDPLDEITLLFAGDVLFDDSYAGTSTLRKRENGIYDCFSQDLLQEMQDADIFMLNNEFPYTNRGMPIPDKQYTFRAKPENVEFLGSLGVDIVSLANNHTFDYGLQGFEDTLTTLNDYEMPYVGAGENLEDAQKPVYVNAGEAGIIAYVSATQIERLASPDTKGAAKNSPGTLRCWTDTELEHLLESVRLAKENSDFVVVYIHWGSEGTTELDWAQTTQAVKIAEAGADLIIGDHPHILQQIAMVQNTPVIYSLGNYWFNSKVCDTGLVKVTIKSGKLTTYQFIPAQQSNCITTLLQGAEKQRVLNEMQTLSPDVIIDSEGYVQFR